MEAREPVSAVEYHERTKHSPRSVREGGRRLDFDNKPTSYKTYVDLPREPLPDEPQEPGTPALEAIAVDRPEPPARDPYGVREAGEPFGDLEPDEIDRETLAQLCYYAAGITKEIELRDRTVEFRAAACTGALYHVDLYPVCADLADLDAGVYHYDPRTDSLDVLRRGDYRGVLAEASGDDRVAEAPVTFVSTSTWWRNAWKYGNRTFRHAFWDSGTVLANLLAVAHARGLPASAVLGFADDSVVDLLGIDPTDEAPLELVPVGGGDPVPEPRDVEPIDPGTEPLSPNPEAYPLIHRAWRTGSFPDGEAAADWREVARSNAGVGTRGPGEGGEGFEGDGEGSEDGGERVALDPVDRDAASARPLGNAIVRRGSCREYEREPISFRKFSTVLDRAVRGSPLDVRPPGGPPLSFVDCYLVVNAVAGLEPGTYQLRAVDGESTDSPDVALELERLRAGEFREEAGHLALDQRLGADAAVCAYFMADVETIAAELGDRGYRAAQFEAAVTAGRLYLATYAHRGLGGTGLTFYDDVVTDFFAPRADGQTPMFLYTLGRPA